MRKLFELLAVACLFALPAFGQNFAAPTSTIVDGTGHPVAGATVTVCSGALTLPPVGTVCSPTTTIYSSFSGAAQANPFPSDGFGNWPFFAPTGNYLISISGGPLVAFSFYMSIGGGSVVPPIVLTAQTDATLPLQINSHSVTQSAPLLDVNNQSSGTADTPAVIRGRGFGSFTPAANKALFHLIQESAATAYDAWVITNHAADVSKGSSNVALMAAGVADNGQAQWCGGGAVGDGGTNNYSCLFWTATDGIVEACSNAAACAAVVPFAVRAANSQTADIFDILNSSSVVLSRFDQNGVFDGPIHVTVTTAASVAADAYDRTIFMNQEATAGTAVTYTLPTAANGLMKCAMNSNNGTNPDTGILTLQTSAAGQFIIFTDGTLSASGGFVSSPGAAGDNGCVVGVDGTHWQFFQQSPTAWTKH
jgi:hypothetical protein